MFIFKLNSLGVKALSKLTGTGFKAILRHKKASTAAIVAAVVLIGAVLTFISTGARAVETNGSAPNTNSSALLPTYNPGHMEAYLSEKITGCTYNIENKKYIFSYSDSKSPATPFVQSDISNADSLLPTQDYPPFVSDYKTAVIIAKNNTLTVAYSDDKGETWSYSNPLVNTKIRSDIGALMPVPWAGTSLGSCFVSFPSKNVGYLAFGVDLMSNHHASGIFKTTDGGKNWGCLTQNDTVNAISGLTFTSDSTGYFTTYCTAGNFLDVYKTTDGGASWTDTSMEIPDNSVYSLSVCVMVTVFH